VRPFILTAPHCRDEQASLKNRDFFRHVPSTIVFAPRDRAFGLVSQPNDFEPTRTDLMTCRFVFADEAGDFTFKRKIGASKYFLLCTLTTDDCSLSNALLDIRRNLVAAGEPDRDKLHTTSDSQATRDKVFECLESHSFEIDATILEKSKAQPQTRSNDATFYQYAWYYHFNFVGPRLLSDDKKLLVTAAALGQKKTRATLKQAVNNTLQQTARRDRWEVTFIESSMDPILWAADYCAWAIQRKWERDDRRSYDLISSKIKTEFDLWRKGTTHFY